MTVEIRSKAEGSPTTFQYVIALSMTDKGISFIQVTETESTIRTFEVGYSATVIK